MSEQKGFTTIELLIATGLVATLIAIAFPLYRGFQSEAEAAAVLAHVAELEEPLLTYTRTHQPLGVCQDFRSDVNLPSLDNTLVALALTFSPLDSKDSTQGYRASVVVSADPSKNLQAARDVYTALEQQSRLAKGATLTDTFVAYEVYLTPGDDPFCQSMSMNSATAASSSATPSATPGSSVPAVQAAAISFNFSTQQEVVEFGQSGTGTVINNGPLQTGGDMDELAVEFNILGGHQVSSSGIHGATFISYGVPGNSDEFYIWKPSDLTVRIKGVEYATGIDTTLDSQTHRYSTLWSSTTGKLQVLVDGVVRFTKDGIAQGYSIPGSGVLALAQDQDRFQLEDGSHGGDHGFAPGDAFHGQIFNAAIANRLPDPASLQKAPLGNVLDAAGGLIANIQMSGGVATDLTGQHQLTMHGEVIKRTVSVDAAVAVPNPGAKLALSISVAPASGDTLIDLKLVGLLPRSLVSDSDGNSGNGSSISVLGWALSNISADLPAGIANNMNIGVIATTKGKRGDISTASAYKPLVLDPSKPVPARSN